jgi:hypothetical protein
MMRSILLPGACASILLGAPAPASAETDGWLRLVVSGPLSRHELAEALELRVGRGVLQRGVGAPSARPTWTLHVDAARARTTVRLYATDGLMWEEEVPASPGASDRRERVRTVALVASYLLARAGAPGVPTHPRAGVVGWPSGEAAPAGPAAPFERPAAAGFVTRWDDEAVLPALRAEIAFLLGAGVELPGDTEGPLGALALGGRLGLAWAWGLWVHAEVGWHYVPGPPSDEVTMVAEVLPLRAGVGWVFDLDGWRLGAALQGVADYWWTSGWVLPDHGWQGGIGVVAGLAHPLGRWVTVGAEMGTEFVSPTGRPSYWTAYEQDVLGPWRWRGSVWVGTGIDLL